MKNLLKTLVLYDRWFPYISESYVYRRIKSLAAKRAVVKYGNPSQGMFIIGVTGTDGKTTTCNLIHKVVNDNLGKALLVSTANIKIGDQETFNHYKMTSLDPSHLQALWRMQNSRVVTMQFLKWLRMGYHRTGLKVWSLIWQC